MEKNIVMVDIETTGLDKDLDDILEISMVRAELEGGVFYPTDTLDLFLPSRREPANDFAKQHMGWLYDHCNNLYKSTYLTPVDDLTYSDILKSIYNSSREKILDFFNDWSDGQPTIAVWNAGFDLQFLQKKSILFPNDYDYRVYEMSGMTMGFMDSLGFPSEMRSEFLEIISGLDTAVSLPTADDLPQNATEPESLEHWGHYDSKKQLKVLNGYLKVMRDGLRSVGGISELAK